MENKEHEVKIVKRRTTTLKLIVDRDIYNSEDKQRQYLANAFDCPELLKTETKFEIEANYNEHDTTELYGYVQDLLKYNGIDITTLKGYKETPRISHDHSIGYIWRKIRDLCDIGEETSISYQYTNTDEHNGMIVYSMDFLLKTTGKTKTEIKGVHKGNVLKLLHYLREHKIPFAYDCEWSFEGNRTCTL